MSGTMKEGRPGASGNCDWKMRKQQRGVKPLVAQRRFLPPVAVTKPHHLRHPGLATRVHTAQRTTTREHGAVVSH
ncbi:hypothetical protein J6590_103659 [Homalodisca vitripennis]|nr:hypothetical protein J6590_103659 [Homalodisca vitripennis]